MLSGLTYSLPETLNFLKMQETKVWETKSKQINRLLQLLLLVFIVAIFIHEHVGNKELTDQQNVTIFCYIVPSIYSCLLNQCSPGREVSNLLITTLCVSQLKETEIFVT